MAITSRYSRLRNYDIIYDEKLQTKRLGFYQNNIYHSNKSEDDTVFTVTKGLEHRIDLISVKFYGTSKLDWFISEYNNIENPIKDIVAGKVLRIPSRFFVGQIT